MYIALCLMICGLLLGRLLHKFARHALIGRLVFVAILFLLFLLGMQIGANDQLFADLPSLGGRALLLMLFCVGGSLLVVGLLARFLQGGRLNGAGKPPPDAR